LLASAIVPRTVKILKNQLFSIEEKIRYKMVYNTLQLGRVSHQQSRFKVKNDVGESVFLKKSLAVKGLRHANKCFSYISL